MNGFFRDENSYVILSTLSIPLNGFGWRVDAEAGEILYLLSIPLNGFRAERSMS